MQRRSLVVRTIWAACLLVAAANHARILLRHGLFWDYGGIGWASSLYWSSLTVFDPLAAALLFLRPRAGIAATVLLIATNVVHNLALSAGRAPPGAFLAHLASSPFLLGQIGFLLFVAATAPVAWKGVAGTGDGRSARAA